MDEKLKKRLQFLFGTLDSWNIFLSYLEAEEKAILDANRNAVEDTALRTNQGKLQLLHKMKALRETIRN